MIGENPTVGVTSVALTERLLGTGLRILIIALLTYLIVRDCWTIFGEARRPRGPCVPPAHAA